MSRIPASGSDLLFEPPFSYNDSQRENNTLRLASLPSLLHFSNVDIFATAKEQIGTCETFSCENKQYSPFNDYFGLANIIKSFGNVASHIGSKEQIYPTSSTGDALKMEDGINKLKSTWQSNSIHQNMKQTLDREHSFRMEDGAVGYGEPLSNGIWNNADTDSSTHTSPLTPQTFASFTPIDTELRMSPSIQHHVISMLHGEELLKLKRMEGKHSIVHTGSIGDEDSLSEGSNNGICGGRGLMSSAVSAAIANGVANLNGSDDNKFQRHRRVKLCVFCRNNGEPETIYKSHILKDSQGKVTCPVLRAYTCPTCGASGDDAHTLKYCPATQPTIIFSPGIPDNITSW